MKSLEEQKKLVEEAKIRFKDCKTFVSAYNNPNHYLKQEIRFDKVGNYDASYDCIWHTQRRTGYGWLYNKGEWAEITSYNEISDLYPVGTAEATGQKILRQADSAIKSQIASLNGDTISLEDAVTSAKEAEDLALINNAQLITSRETYVRSLLTAKNKTTEAEEALKLHLEKIAFLNSKLEAINAEAEA